MFNITALAKSLGLAIPKKLPFLRNGVQPVSNIIPSKDSYTWAGSSTSISATSAGTGTNITIPSGYIKDGTCKIFAVTYGGQDADQSFTIASVGVTDSAGNNVFFVPGSGYTGGIVFPFGQYISVSNGTDLGIMCSVCAYTTAGNIKVQACFIHPSIWELI